MRKKWTYVAIVSMMLGVAPVFTGCVDTDEPAGITELRGAKAELLRAKAAVEQARVALVQAKAAKVQAEAATEQAYAEWQAQQARAAQIANDMQEAKNELELQKLQAEYEKIIADINNLKELAAINHETNKANAQKEAAAAQYAYETVLKQIEIAKALGISDYEQATLAELEKQVTILYDELYGNAQQQANGDFGLYGDLRDAEENLYDAQLNKSMGYDTDKNGNQVTSEVIWEDALKAEINIKKAQLAAEEQTLEDLKALADKDVAGTDWAAEIDALAEEIAALEVEIKDMEAQLVRDKATPEYLAAYQAVYGVYSDYKEDGITPADGATIVKTGTKKNLKKANDALVDASYDTDYAFSFDKFETSTAITEAMSEALLGKDDHSLADKKLSVAGQKDFVWGNDGDATKLPTEVQNALAQYEAHLDLFKDRVVDENDIEQAKAVLKQKQEAAETAKDAYEEAYADWEEVKDIIAEGTTIQVDVTGFKKVTDAYNTAYGALETAVDNWNKGLQNAYDEAYDNAEAKATLKLKIAALGGNGTAIPQITAIPGFEESKVIESWRVYDGTDNQTEAYLASLISMNCTAVEGNADYNTKAKVEKAVTDALAAYVRQEQNSMNWDDSAFKAAGDAAASAFGGTDAGKALQAALNKAEGDVETAYGKLPAAIEAFKALSLTFAQANDDKVLNIGYLAYAKDKEGKPAASLGDWVADATGSGALVGTVAKKVVGNSEITTDEFTAATTTKFSADLAQDALDKVSIAAFGEANRYAPVDIEKAEGGAAKAYQDALDAVAQQEAIISANDDLKAMRDEIQKAYDGLKADIAAQYQTVFATLLKNIDDAQAAHDKASADLDKANEPFEAQELAIAEEKAKLAGKKSISNKLVKYVNSYLSDAVLEDGTAVKYDPETFAVKMAEAVAVQEGEVADAEQDVKEAEVALEKAQAGKFDGVDYFTMVRDFAKERFDAKMEEYTKAQENVAKALEIMAGTDAEQPAE